MIRILIADDHSIVRRGLKEILTEEFPKAHINAVNDGTALMRKARNEKWDIIISDLTMPGKNGMEVLKELKEEFPKIPVLILSMHPEYLYAIRALRAGAAGYLSKESASEELVNAVRMILNGRKYITPSVAEKLAENLEQDSTKELHETLSDREFDILKLIASGKNITEIGKNLSISKSTVSTHRGRILVKMKMRTNSELTHYAIKNNLL
jgi:two-component system, NarL family, invasion response regulator UvrY